MKRQLNKRAIQKLLDEDVGSKEEEWKAILGLKFNVRFIDCIGHKMEYRVTLVVWHKVLWT